jgi:hypothetical protein
MSLTLSAAQPVGIAAEFGHHAAVEANASSMA